MDQEEKVAPRVRFGELRLPDEEDGYATHDRRHERNLSRRSSVLEERALFNRRLRYPSLVSRYSTPSACTTRTDSTCQRSDRTLSIEIDEDQHKKQNEVKRAKEKAAVGKCTGCKSQSRVLNISLQISQTSNGIHSLSMSCAAVSPSISNMAFLTTRPSGVLANTARTR
jgi:hypothetical protein